jgi:hypothetical protein
VESAYLNQEHKNKMKMKRYKVVIFFFWFSLPFFNFYVCYYENPVYDSFTSCFSSLGEVTFAGFRHFVQT